jgi:hypothetical protein
MPKTTQITVSAQSKPGVLAKVCDALGKAGVNIVAVCAAESAGRGKIRLVVNDTARAKSALTAAKIRCSEEPALLLSMDDRPGALADVAGRLAAAKVNIKCAYASTAGGGRAQVVVAVANPDKAERALA